MTLTDAGPLVAIIDADEADHDACVAALDELELPLVTTWPAFTEAMCLLGSAGGIHGQRALWRLVETGRLRIGELSEDAVRRSARLMWNGLSRGLVRGGKVAVGARLSLGA